MVYQVGDSDDFAVKLTEAGDKAVVVDFYATWCGPCKMVAPFLQKLDDANPTIVVLKVDVDECEELAQDHRVEAMPTFIVFKGGEEVERIMGANKEKLEEVFNKYK